MEAVVGTPVNWNEGQNNRNFGSMTKLTRPRPNFDDFYLSKKDQFLSGFRRRNLVEKWSVYGQNYLGFIGIKISTRNGHQNFVKQFHIFFDPNSTRFQHRNLAIYLPLRRSDFGDVNLLSKLSKFRETVSSRDSFLLF